MRLALALTLAVAPFAVACGSSDTADTTTTTTTTTSTGGAAAGATTYKSVCASCHGADAAGNLGPNITGSMSAGIGAWTEEQFITALRTGVNADGLELCSKMPKYGAAQLTDADLANVFAHLSTLSNDSEMLGTLCP